MSTTVQKEMCCIPFKILPLIVIVLSALMFVQSIYTWITGFVQVYPVWSFVVQNWVIVIGVFSTVAGIIGIIMVNIIHTKLYTKSDKLYKSIETTQTNKQTIHNYYNLIQITQLYNSYKL